MKRLVIAALVATATLACARQSGPVDEDRSAANAESTAPSADSVPPAAAGNAAGTPSEPATTSGAPTPPPAATIQAPTLIRGRVLETLSAAGYTYVRLETEQGERWAAVNQAKVEKGATLTVVPDIVMENFESKTLGRTFARIVFGRVAGNQTAGTAALASAPQAIVPAAMTTQAGNPHAGASRLPIDPGVIAVDVAPGGKRVEALWTERVALSGTEVVVRGKVVKFNPGIMGKNWIHLRDGSGSQDRGTNDITVTTDETAGVGDVITVKGTLKIDQDLGAGYVYGAIVVDAKVVR